MIFLTIITQTHTHYDIACTPQRSKLVNTVCL